jgi:hypothetical protein
MRRLEERKRFRFESFWIHLPGFLEVVSSFWDLSLHAYGPENKFSLKLKRLFRALHSWDHSKVGNIKIQLGMAREILHRLEMAQDCRSLSVSEEWLKGNWASLNVIYYLSPP